MCHINRHNSCARSCSQKTKFYVMVDLSVLVALQYLKAVIIMGRPIYPSQFLSENQIRVLFFINWSNQYSDCIVFRVYLSMWKSKTFLHKTWVGQRKSFLLTWNVKASEFVPVPGIQWGKNPLFLRLWFSNIDFVHNSLSFGWFHPIDIDCV